jgi:hypothetical protein
MIEKEQARIPLEEIISSLTEVVGMGQGGLLERLHSIGYDMTTQGREGGRIVWIHADYDTTLPRNAPSVALIITKNGLLHAPKFDEFRDEGLAEAKLVKIEVPQYEKGVRLSFEGLHSKDGDRVIKLATVHTIKIL